MKSFLLIFLFLFLYKLVSNASFYFMSKFYETAHFNYLFVEGKCSDIHQYQHGMKKLVKRAGLVATSVPVVHNMGYGQLASYSADAMDNVACRQEDIALVVAQSIRSARGVFRTRVIECFSPIYWIELVIFMPKNIFTYLGLGGDSFFLKLFQLLWWIGAPAAIICRDKLYVWITAILAHF